MLDRQLQNDEENILYNMDALRGREPYNIGALYQQNFILAPFFKQGVLHRVN